MGLKRMNKNRISYHVMCLLMAVLIMFCALAPRLSVCAADTSSGVVDDRYYKYVPFADIMSKNGYIYYSQVNMAYFDKKEERNNASTCNLEVLENNKYFKTFLSKYYPTYSSFADTFDCYGLVGSYYGGYEFSKACILLVE